MKDFWNVGISYGPNVYYALIYPTQEQAETAWMRLNAALDRGDLSLEIEDVFGKHRVTLHNYIHGKDSDGKICQVVYLRMVNEKEATIHNANINKIRREWEQEADGKSTLGFGSR